MPRETRLRALPIVTRFVGRRGWVVVHVVVLLAHTMGRCGNASPVPIVNASTVAMQRSFASRDAVVLCTRIGPGVDWRGVRVVVVLAAVDVDTSKHCKSTTGSNTKSML